MISIITCMGRDQKISGDGHALFEIPADISRFKEITKNKPVIMSHEQWLTLKKAPLQGRLNIVVDDDPVRTGGNMATMFGTNPVYNHGQGSDDSFCLVIPVKDETGLIVAGSLDKAIRIASGYNTLSYWNRDCDEIIILGGIDIYKDVLSNVDRMYFTVVDDNIENECVCFPDYNKNDWENTHESEHMHNSVSYKFLTLERKKHD